MFDDPKKELEQLEESLLAAEESNEEFEHFFEEMVEEFGHEQPKEDEDYLKEILEDIPTLGKEGPNKHTEKKRPAAAVRRKENNLPLVLLLCLECLGIALVAVWWLERLF